MSVKPTPVFTKWFGDSKVVDVDGSPLIVYHGTADDFSVFDLGKVGSKQYSDWGAGIYLTPRRSNADYYRIEAVKKGDPEYNAAFAKYEALEQGVQTINGTPQYSNEAIAALKEFQRIGAEKNQTAEGHVKSVYVSIRNPHIQAYSSMPDPALADRAAARGHDGIFVLNPDGGINEIIAFEPAQIKSATCNSGAFDTTHTDIRFSLVDQDEDIRTEAPCP